MSGRGVLLGPRPTAGAVRPPSPPAVPDRERPGVAAVGLPVLWLAIAVLLAVDYGAVFVLVADGPLGYLATFADDFFYYVVIAENLLTDGRSTFDGTTPTNGYHPLWFAVLTLLGAVFDVRAEAYFLAVFVTGVLLSLVGYVGARRLLRERLDGFGWRETAAGLYLFIALGLARTGMEVVLVLALMPWFVLRLARAYDDPGGMSAAGTGLLASLVVLARLDMILFVVPAVAMLAWRSWRHDGRGATLRRALAFGLGGALLPAYLLFNLAVFGGAMPTSGAAKGLVTAFGFSPGFLRQLFLGTRNLPTFVFPTAAALAVVAAVVLLAVPAVRRRVHPILRLLLLFPIAYHLITATRADWPLWSWYYYAVALAMPVAAAVVAGTATRVAARLVPLGPLARGRLDVGFAALSLLALAATTGGLALARGTTPEREHLLTGAERLRDFARTRPGVYAMGDRAGKTGYLLGRPLVQLEGLVADRRMLERIAAEADIVDVLREYGADYYVTTDLRRDAAGCWLAVEPLKAGPRAPHMRARLCAEPLLTFTITRVRGIKDSFTTRVFRVADLGRGSRSPARR